MGGGRGGVQSLNAETRAESLLSSDSGLWTGCACVCACAVLHSATTHTDTGHTVLLAGPLQFAADVEEGEQDVVLAVYVHWKLNLHLHTDTHTGDMRVK